MGVSTVETMHVIVRVRMRIIVRVRMRVIVRVRMRVIVRVQVHMIVRVARQSMPVVRAPMFRHAMMRLAGTSAGSVMLVCVRRTVGMGAIVLCLT